MKKITNKIINNICTDYVEKGIPQKEIAKKYNITLYAVRKALLHSEVYIEKYNKRRQIFKINKRAKNLTYEEAYTSYVNALEKLEEKRIKIRKEENLWN